MRSSRGKKQAQRWKCRCWKLEHSRPQEEDGWGKRRSESRTCLPDSILEQCLWMTTYVSRIPASILKLSLHFLRWFTLCLWYIPQDTCHVEDSFQCNQFHPYFPSWVMSGCKLAHFIVQAFMAFDMPLTIISLYIGTLCRDPKLITGHQMSLQYAVSTDVRWGVIVPRGSHSTHP